MMSFMCFSIPVKIIEVKDDVVVVENGKIIRIDKKMDVKKGNYIQVVGDMAVNTLSENEGLKIRKMIKKLNN
jgi:hydrogenase maturation factor